MIILDTNVLSSLMHETPDPRVIGWLDEQLADEVWTTAVTVLEVRTGLEMLPAGKRRRRLEDAFAATVDGDLAGRVLPFDRAAAERTGALIVERQGVGAVMELRDAQIAGIALVQRGVLATRHVKHFDCTGLKLVNPFSAR